jgi:hypothetical protein
VTLPYDEVTLANGAVLRVHAPDKCAGQICSVHNPSDHPLKDAPRAWRASYGLFERECEHKIGHPDPDALAFLVRLRGESASHLKYHGCDGCCVPPRKPIVMEFVKRELPRSPRLLPLAKWLAGRLGTLSRDWALCFAAVCLAILFLGSQSGFLFVGMLCGATYYASTTSLVHCYKNRHPQYFRRSNS